MNRGGPLVGLAALALAGCRGAGSPSVELSDARVAIAQARESPVAGEALQELADAEEAYAHAERTGAAHPGGAEERQAAYLARRLAERARLAGLYGASIEALATARESVERLRRNLARRASAVEERERLAVAEEAGRKGARTLQRLELGRACERLDGAGERERELVAHLSIVTLFEDGTARLRGRARARVRALAEALRDGPPSHVRLVVLDSGGATGADGPLLAQRRRQRLREALVEAGVPRETIEEPAGPPPRGSRVDLFIVEQPVLPAPPVGIPLR